MSAAAAVFCLSLSWAASSSMMLCLQGRKHNAVLCSSKPVVKACHLVQMHPDAYP